MEYWNNGVAKNISCPFAQHPTVPVFHGSVFRGGVL